MALMLALPGAARAQSSLTPTWSSMIAYYNPSNSSSGTTEMSIIYYKSTGGSEVTKGLPLLGHQSGVVLVGSTANFKGSAVISSDVPLMAVYKQESIGKEAFSPILYSSFDLSRAGEGDFYLPSVQRTALMNTQVGIQNIGSISIEVSLDFYNDSGTNINIPKDNFPGGQIPPQASRIFKLSEISALPAGFDGSLVIHAALAGETTEAGVVAVAQDIVVGGRQAYTYEGVGDGVHDVYLPAALCQVGSDKQTTHFWVQNTGTSATGVTIDLFDNSKGAEQHGFLRRINQLLLIHHGGQPGALHVQQVVIENHFSRANDSGGLIAVVGKTISSDGLYTAFTGQPSPTADITSGNFPAVVMPYVEYSSSKSGYKTYITVQNAGDTAAVDVVVKYYPRGALTPVKTVTLGTIQPGSMLATDAAMVHAYSAGSRGFYGVVVVESASPMVSLARVQYAPGVSGASVLGEDYNGQNYYPPTN